MRKSNDIWVYAEHNGQEISAVTFEMIAEAKKLAKKVNGKTCACLMGLIGDVTERFCSSLKNHGIDVLHLMDGRMFSENCVSTNVFALQKLLEQNNPWIIMIGSTPLGCELAPSLASRLRWPCITEVKHLSLEDDNLVVAKSCYEDNVYKYFRFQPGRPLILTVLPGDMDSEYEQKPGSMQIIKQTLDDEAKDTRIRSIKIIKGNPKSIRLEEADLIVAGGRGLGGNLSILEELADKLGASIGSTRTLVDDGVLPFQRQIGITGKSVAPKMMLACGISGAREFMAGIDKTPLIIAINTDSRAPIFNSADLGVHGDVSQVIPALIKKLKPKTGANRKRN